MFIEILHNKAMTLVSFQVDNFFVGFVSDRLLSNRSIGTKRSVLVFTIYFLYKEMLYIC
ncbi:MAG: hypothetical protein ACI93H_001749 [Psychromonas sp.]|jgi:hypothetical protein